jgi:hypothetical protein
MPATTATQAIPYPYTDEAATPVSAQNLATRVDTLLTTADTNRTKALKRPTAQVRRNTGTQSCTIAVATPLTFDTEDWDTWASTLSG